MLISDSMKAINIPQSLQSENTALCGGGTTNNATGNTNATPAPAGTGTPLRSRNQNRGDKQSDDKSENVSSARGKNPPKPPDEFYRDLQQFHEKRSTPIRNIPRITGHEVDLHRLYCEVIERGGFQKVNMRDEWEEVLPELGWKDKIVNGSAGLKYIYRRFLEKYERINYFGEDPEKVDASESTDIAEIMGTASSGRSGRGTSRYPSSLFGNAAAANAAIHNVAMTYNYKQHHINLEKRRQFKLSTDLHKPSPYEKLMLSLLSPLPNEQDFAINACTLMANESKHTMKLAEYPKLLDALLAHTGVFSDYPMRKLFQHIYSGVRHHSLYGFWYDLLHEQPQILDLYSDEQAVREAGLIDDWDDGKNYIEEGIWCDSKELDFLNLGRGLGTQDHVGQRVLQVVAILRNLSFFEENLPILVKNKTFLRFLVMSSNIRWSNVHIQALEIAGNIVGELDLLDPSSDDLSRCLMSTICDGIEGSDRGVIINCLEILYKLCQRDTNEDYVLKSLEPKFYNTMALFLSLNDIMLLLFTLEAIYALTCLGSKSCHSMMQVRGIIDQLVSLISVEAQSYGPDGCILMRVVETVPGNMLPMVAQNIANLQNAAVIQKPNHILHVTTPSLMKAHILPNSPMLAGDMAESIPVPPAPPAVTAAPPLEHTHSTPQIQMPINFTHEDEQYALAWLGATFERTVNTECHVEQQELYRMYLSHCQKSGKHSVVNHVHFPRLVRLIFTNSVGPAIVRKVDGTDLAGLHYVSIRLRAQPLPLQQKTSAGAALPSIKQADTVSPVRKAKKKLKPTENNSPNAPNEAIVPSSAIVENVKLDLENASNTISTATDVTNNSEQSKIPPQSGETTRTVDKMEFDEPEVETKTEEAESELSTATAETTACQPHSSQSSMIKSLLANKVNQRQQKQKDVANTIIQTTSTSQTNIASQQPIKVASAAITALVNNPLMQNTPVKVGQTTIKPLNPQLALEKKQHITESTPPPLAPLSGANVVKDATGRPILVANHVLADILDKKVADSPMTSSIVQKRKMEDTHAHNKRLAVDSSNCTSAKETPVTPSKNAANLYAEMAASILEDEDLEEFSSQSSSSTNPQAIFEQPIQHQSSLIVPSKVQQSGCAIPGLQNVPRQLMFQSNQPPQLKMTQTSAGTTTQQIPNAVATIKTDQGLQTVPVILHQKPMDSTSQTQIIQQVMQPSPSPQTQTQYVLATNQQGQTYLVAQQTQPQPPPPPQQPTQTVLVTQTPQQQSTGAKTIIILQQQPLQGSQQPQQIISTSTQGQPQKMIMTTAQGQQVLVTQRPQTPQQIFINPQTGAATHIQHVPVTQSRQIIQTTSATVSSQQQAPPQLQAGQISPSLLNQLNQIPATIKLHQPIAQTPSGSRINMPKGGSVSIVQGPPPPQPTPTGPVAIPQLQQHQSIIQQHIISGPSEKRHVILGGGRAIEIKETLITQAQPPPQQCQLNSQTIITTQQQPSGSTPPLLQQQTQQQVQQQIRAVLEQQQHPSIIQQKISTFSAMSQQSQQHISLSQASQQSHVQVTMPAGPNITQTPALLAAKVSDSTPTSLIPAKTMPSLPSVILPGGAANQAAIKKSLLPGPPSLIKPSLPTVKLPNSNISGPPPLAAVNSAITSASSTAGQPLYNLPTNPADKDSNRKEEVVKNTDAPSVRFSQNPIQSSVTTNTTSTAIPTQATSATLSATSANPAAPSAPLPTIPQQPPPSNPQQAMPSQQQLSASDAQWLYICDWRNCPRKKFKSISDLQHHVCTAHAPDHLDQYAEIFCQWGVGPGLCDGIPRRRYSLMTHLLDRHISVDVLRAAAQRRIATGMHNIAPTKPAVTIVRNNVEMTPHINPGSTAFQTMKRHTADFINCKELMDENEGPVTKSIRLTAALILRNLVTYTATAKRAIRRHESHLANIALSNVESSGTISHILYELNN